VRKSSKASAGPARLYFKNEPERRSATTPTPSAIVNAVPEDSPSEVVSMRPLISVIIPVYNEDENLDSLISRLHPILEPATNHEFEIIFVDDGSRDGSSEMLDALNARDPRHKVIHFSRNFGHQSALEAGLNSASGRAVILMDADLQDPPELIERFIAKWKEGYEVVYAIRTKRKEPVWKRWGYAAFYRIMKIIGDIEIPLDAGDFCLMDYRVVETLVAFPERNKFLRGLRSWVGFKQTGIEYERGPRSAGKPKYTLGKLMNLALSGYIGFSSLPLRAAAWFGLVFAVTGFALTIWVIVDRLTNPIVPQGWASTTAIVLVVGGVQLLMLGVIGEYLGRVYDEVRRRPPYIIGSRVGFSAKK
jgi:dolichol-phosphate mannosyltransferase